MGLVTTSFTPTSSGVTLSGYGPTKAFVANWYRESPGGDSEGAAYTSRVQIKTDGAGAKSISFTINTRSGWSNNHLFNGTVYWAVSTSTSRPSSGTAATLAASSPYAKGTITVNLLPNTTYYVHFWYSGYVYEYRGTLTFSTSGTYGEPGEISANNTTFDSPINMSYGSATAGGAYTVKVKVGTSAEVTLQTQNSTSSRSWTPSLAAYGSSYPNQASVSCVITVSTYFGGTLSGTKTKTVTISFTAAQVGPSTANAFSIAPQNEGAVAGMSGYIQGYSKIRASFNSANVTRQYGATIAKWTVKFGSAAAADVAAGTATKDSGAISATTTVVCTVVDSRGFTASETYTATITPYQQPTLTASAFRCDSEGVSADDGTYISVSCAALYADIAGQNTMIVQAFAKLRSSSTWGNAVTITGGSTAQTGTNDTYTASGFLISGFSDAVWDVKIVATDALGNTAIIEIIIESQAWALHIRNGGAGAAFGKAAEADKQLQIPADWDIYKGIQKFILSAYPVGSIYMSVNSTSPETLFGGTWERITGRFLLAATDGGAAGGNSNASIAPGNTGGEAAHTLALTEAPSHSHTVNNHTHAPNSGTAWGFLTYKINTNVTRGKVSTASGSRYAHLGTSGASSADASNLAFAQTTNGSTPGTNSQGGGGAHNNMPPYLAVYVWKRTA